MLPNTQVEAVLRELPLSWLDSALPLIRSLAACACLRTSALGSLRIRSKAGIASFVLVTGQREELDGQQSHRVCQN